MVKGKIQEIKNYFLKHFIFLVCNRGGWGYSDRVLVCFLLYTDYPILDKLSELCPFMQTVIPHENRVDGFFLTHFFQNHQF